MKMLLKALIGLVAVVVLILVVQVVASESAEVVVLTTTSGGAGKETRLWVVDADGVQYLRAKPDSGWYLALLAAQGVTLTRGDGTMACRAEARPGFAVEVNRLMREKYGWRDAYISALVGGRDNAVPVAMIPAG